MPWFLCPHCDHWVYSDQVRDQPPDRPVNVNDLPAPAFALLANAPEDFRNGAVLPVRAWLEITPYKSLASIHSGLQALEHAGYVKSVSYGRRRQYAGTAKLREFKAA